MNHTAICTLKDHRDNPITGPLLLPVAMMPGGERRGLFFCLEIRCAKNAWKTGIQNRQGSLIISNLTEVIWPCSGTYRTGRAYASYTTTGKLLRGYNYWNDDMEPPCLTCQIHTSGECKYNPFCMYRCQARIDYCQYIDKLIDNSYLAIDSADQELRYQIESRDNEIRELLQETYFQE